MEVRAARPPPARTMCGEAGSARGQGGFGEDDAAQFLRLDAAARAYVGFAVANAALLDLMFSAKHSPEASQALGATAHRWSEQLLGLIGDGQRRGEVRKGPLEQVALPVFAALHGFADLTVSGMLPESAAEHGLDDVIASVLRQCKPE
ncbi:TetR-like C-terminal domain-containing protein [Nonomuraea sp. NPDC050153]|uniref:TetR-like C-terminal domain-containing protein n=1 Tax=Nonomuraea sp. NPDC050153 TaxID=3364359 RepID=UPI0037B5422C